MSLKERSDMLLEDLARTCREIYIKERQNYELTVRGRASRYSPGPKWDGGVTRDGVNATPVWPKIAKFMLKHNLDPQQCIQYRFMTGSRGVYRPVLPNQIALPKYLEDYLGMTEDVRSGLRHAFDFEKAFCRKRLTVMHHLRSDTRGMDDILDEVLLNDGYPLSPLFRYSLARETRRKAASRRYRREALVQYLRFPDDYDEIWGDSIPDTFRESARAIASTITGQQSNA